MSASNPSALSLTSPSERSASDVAHLVPRLLRLAPQPGIYDTPVEGLRVARLDTPGMVENCLYEPAIALIIQGAKQSVIGHQAFEYGAGFCMVNGVDLPSQTRITLASTDCPFLAVSLRINRRIAMELGCASDSSGADGKQPEDLAVSVAEMSSDVVDAFARLLDATENERDLPILAPLLVREIHYRMLIGSQGGTIRSVFQPGSMGNQVAAAIARLKTDFARPVRIDDLAAEVGMPTSSFYRQFKAVTSVSPLQFQKRLRLHEAQRLMLTDHLDAATAALSVGYQSATQFNREYKRLFGAPPHRDVDRLLTESRGGRTDGSVRL